MALEDLIKPHEQEANCRSTLKALLPSGSAFLAAHTLDMVTTHRSMAKFGIEGELNPFTRASVDLFGLDAGLAIYGTILATGILGMSTILQRHYADTILGKKIGIYSNYYNAATRLIAAGLNTAIYYSAQQ